MRIETLFYGILADWVGVKEAAFDLPAGSVFGDLLAAIGGRYEANMPYQLWDSEKKTFKEHILAEGRDRTLEDPDAPLLDNEKIKFYLMMAGG